MTLPLRSDNSEAAFRKYESALATACNGTIEINPAPLKAHTYVAKFNEARLGWLRFHYTSKLLSANADVACIKARALSNGNVQLWNPVADLAKLNNTTEPTKPAQAKEFSCTIATLELTLAAVEPDDLVVVKVRNDSEAKQAQEAKKRHGNLIITRL